jgi:hypothetical protein
MKVPIVVLIAELLVVLLSLCISVSAQVQFSKYENPDYKIGIQYPSDWTASEDNLLPHQVVRFSATEVEEEESSVSTFIYIPAELVVAVQPLYSPGMSINQFIYQFFNETYSKPTDYNVIETSENTLDGIKEARKITMYEYVGDKSSKVMRVIAIENGTAYMIKYLAEPGQFSKYLPVAERMISSFSTSIPTKGSTQQQQPSISALKDTQPQSQQQKPQQQLQQELPSSSLPSETSPISKNDNFLIYHNPELGIKIKYSPNWQIEEEEGEQVTFIKQNDIVEFLVDVHELDSPDTTLTDYVGDEITNKREERRNLNLIESAPVTLSGNVQAHKIVYTFVKDDEARFGEMNKILRIYVIDRDKVYTLAYLAESDKYSTYLPIVQNMIESFSIDGLSQSNRPPTSSASPPSISVLESPSEQQQLQTPRSDTLAQSNSNINNNNNNSSQPELPQTLTVTDNVLGDSRLALRSSITNGVAKELLSADSRKGQLYDWFPAVRFHFNDPSQVGLVNLKYVILSPIKSYDSIEDALGEVNYWNDVPLNEQVVLETNEPGLNSLIVSVRFADGTEGVYSAIIDVDAQLTKSDGEDYLDFQMDEDGDFKIIDKSDVEDIESDPVFHRVASTIMCSDLNNYGFRIC